MSRPVRVECRKWPDSPHWEYDAIHLGVDGHGDWIGVPRGTWLSRPGAGFHAQADHVVLVPYDAWWLATFYGEDAERPVQTYVDVATPAAWSEDGAVVRAVDLDLDVVKGNTGRVYVDDEDEFAEHRVSLGYPVEVVTRAVASCEWLVEQLTAGVAPFDRTHLDWIARLRALPEHARRLRL